VAVVGQALVVAPLGAVAEAVRVPEVGPAGPEAVVVGVQAGPVAAEAVAPAGAARPNR
jgi:hypothetical protein